MTYNSEKKTLGTKAQQQGWIRRNEKCKYKTNSGNVFPKFPVSIPGHLWHTFYSL